MHATISELMIYPVKSLAGVSLKEAHVSPTGLEGDRQWMVVDGDGKFVTQRQLPAMATIETSFKGGVLSLNHETTDRIEVKPYQSAEPQHWQIWKDIVTGFAESAQISEWLTGVLGEFRGAPLRLVRLDNQTERRVAPKYLEQQESTLKLADACPFLITCESSLQDLNQSLPQPMPMDRFRSNIVLSGTEAWHEYQWTHLQSEQLNFAMIGACQRCPMTSVDQQKGIIATPGEPLKTLMAKFPVGDKNLPYFGQHAHLPGKESGKLSVGEQLLIKTNTA